MVLKLVPLCMANILIYILFCSECNRYFHVLECSWNRNDDNLNYVSLCFVKAVNDVVIDGEVYLLAWLFLVSVAFSVLHCVQYIVIIFTPR